MPLERLDPGADPITWRCPLPLCNERQELSAQGTQIALLHVMEHLLDFAMIQGATGIGPAPEGPLDSSFR